MNATPPQTSMSNDDIESMAMVLADFYFYTCAKDLPKDTFKVKHTGNVIEFFYNNVDEYDGKYTLTFENAEAAGLWMALANRITNAMREKFHVPGVLIKYEPGK